MGTNKGRERIMRIAFAALFCIGLQAPTAFAQEPPITLPPSENSSSVGSSERVGSTPAPATELSDTGPPVQVELQLPTRVTRAITETSLASTETAAASADIAAAVKEIAATLRPEEPLQMRWWERWAWGIGFVVLAIAAMRLGFRDLNKSVALEREEATARSLQKMIDDGDTTVEAKLLDLVEVYEGKKKRPTNDPVILAARSTKKWFHSQRPVVWTLRQGWVRLANSLLRMLGRRSFIRILRPKFWLLGIGAIVLLALAVVPDETVWPDEASANFRFQPAKTAAWEILNSDFAGAFAVTWVAVLFFWGLQSRRLVEAETKMSVVVEEAKHTLRLAHKDAFRKYSDAVLAVQSQKLSPPRSSVGRHVSADDGEEAADQIAAREEKELQEFRSVRRMAVEHAIGTPLKGEEELELIESETERLKLYSPGFFQGPHSLADFVSLLRKYERLPDGELGEIWKTIADGTPREAIVAISTLADPAERNSTN